jgi:hypothetical protein
MRFPVDTNILLRSAQPTHPPSSFEADLGGGIPRFLPLLSPDEGLKPASEHGKLVARDLGPLAGKREG